eukprot:COSAG02_NODE_415_length_22762_cov_133.681816_6_plen_65_part_00
MIDLRYALLTPLYSYMVMCTLGICTRPANGATRHRLATAAFAVMDGASGRPALDRTLEQSAGYM